MSTATLEGLRKELNRLPSLSTVRTELLRCLTQDDVDLPKVIRLVATDPVIAAKVLRIANSSFFGLPSQVDSLSQAVTLLGVAGLQSVALASAVMDTFKSDTDTAWFDHHEFWCHGIATATCAEQLADRVTLNGSLAFTAGLLHDLGRLAMVTCYPQAYRAAFDHRLAHDLSWREAEMHALGFDHCQAGGLLADHWHLPPSIGQSMALHHDTGHTAAGSLVQLVHVADALAHALDLTGSAHEMVPALQAAAWDALDIEWNDSSALFAAIETQYRRTCDSLLSP